MLFISQLVGRHMSTPYLVDTSRAGRAPGVVWEMGATGGLSPVEAAALIDDVASFGSPFVIFVASGPRLRNDLLSLVRRARGLGVAPVVRFLQQPMVRSIGRLLSAAGASLVTVEPDLSDAAALLAECRAGGVPTGINAVLRSRRALGRALSLAREAGCTVAVLRHLEAGESQEGSDTRDLMDEIYRAACDSPVQIVTDGNNADAVYTCLRLGREDPERSCGVPPAAAGQRSLSSIETATISPDGAVSPEEHWSWGIVGSVRERPFSQIWTDPEQPLLRGLRYRRLLIKGRCRVCGYFELCGGNRRGRAAALGDPWAEDPGCYLTDDEIKRSPR